MRALKALLMGTSFLVVSLVLARCAYAAELPVDRLVRIAELIVDPAHLEAYKRALKEEIASSIRLEPGVLALYAVSVKGHPEQISLFEIYSGEAAYQDHLESAHFKKYKEYGEVADRNRAGAAWLQAAVNSSKLQRPDARLYINRVLGHDQLMSKKRAITPRRHTLCACTMSPLKMPPPAARLQFSKRWPRSRIND